MINFNTHLKLSNKKLTFFSFDTPNSNMNKFKNVFFFVSVKFPYKCFALIFQYFYCQFQYASLGDVFLILIGACSAIIQGSSFPILSIIFGQMTNSFIQQATVVSFLFYFTCYNKKMKYFIYKIIFSVRKKSLL